MDMESQVSKGSKVSNDYQDNDDDAMNDDEDRGDGRHKFEERLDVSRDFCRQHDGQVGSREERERKAEVRGAQVRS